MDSDAGSSLLPLIPRDPMFIDLERVDSLEQLVDVVIDWDVVARGDDFVDEFGVDSSDNVQRFLEFVEVIGSVV